MGSKSKKSKKSHSTSHPQYSNSSNTTLSAFSPQANLFAFLSLAVDKHRLRIYDTVTGKSVAEHVVDSGRVTSLIWGRLNLSEDEDGAAQAVEDPGSSKKKGKTKRLSTGAAPAATAHQPKIEKDLVILGLSDGSILFFSPAHGRVLRTLSHPTSTAPILSVMLVEKAENKRPSVWTSGEDGTVRLWDPRKNDVIGSWKVEDRIPYSAMAIRPGTLQDEGRVDFLVANHAVKLLTTGSAVDAQEIETFKPAQLASFTGHASSINSLHWDTSHDPTTRFLTTAESDRFVYVWELPKQNSTEGRIVLSIPLDSNVRHISVSQSSFTEKRSVLALSTTGKITIYSIPSELPPATSEKSKHKVPILLPRSTVNIISKKLTSPAQIVNATFVSGEENQIKVARVIGGIKPLFDVVMYLDETGNYIKDVNISYDDSEAVSINEVIGVQSKRYTESNSLAVHSGLELGQDQSMDDLALRDIDGDLDVDLAEMSLGQRLTALSGGGDRVPVSDNEDDDNNLERLKIRNEMQDAPSVVPANSLTRTLIQALHSSDSRLLETCLAHSDQTLIRNTIRRMPLQLAVPLLTACVERLGRGARAANMKGGGGGASSQRGTGLIIWVKTVLAVHSGHLMAMPDLVARLAGLHATLTTRLTLQENLLSLSGRLDMVLSQIELRSSAAPAPLAPHKVKATKGVRAKKEPHKYVEGESEEEDDPMDGDVEIESDDDTGSIEDVELGGDSHEDDSDEEDDEEEDKDGSDDSDEGPTMNGFIDDEAEEFDEDDDDDSE